ncbi:MAG: transcriptional regulator, PadR family [Myxococcaceae bacterium]|nr:transcriptional regulator, PadR family [Myxococcaceae bacterium]
MTQVSLRCAILGFLEIEPSTGYLLQQRFQGSIGSFWTATQSQIYRELHSLERSGQVRCEVVAQGKKPARKIYTLTASGRAALRSWLREPVSPVHVRDPLLLRLVFAADVEPTALADVLTEYARSLQQTRAEYQARIGAPEIFALARSEREALLWQLAIENGLAWCEAQLAWTEQALSRLADPAAGPTGSRATSVKRKRQKRGHS